jgi:acyl-CoA thioester hydrolase
MNPDFSIPVRVYWEDTDASGVVYHANYLRWFERARTEWLRRLGFDQEQLRQGQGIAFTVANLEIQYRRPARLDDLLEVSVQVVERGGASLVFEQTVRKPEAAELLAHARVRVACVDAVRFRPRALPFRIPSPLPVPEGIEKPC